MKKDSKVNVNKQTDDKKKKKTMDKGLFIVIFILVAFGLVMVLSASSPSAISTYGDPYYYVRSQALAACIGLILMLILSAINYKIYQKLYVLCYILAVGLLLIVKIPGVGFASHGALRWATIGGVSFQPSELSKILLIVAFAGYFSSPTIDFSKIFYSCVLPNVMIAIPVGILFFVQNHLSAGAVIISTFIAMIFMSGIKFKYYGISITGIASLGAAALYFFKDKLSSGFRSERILAWQHPEDYARTSGYQTLQSLYAIGSGGVFGVRTMEE